MRWWHLCCCAGGGGGDPKAGVVLTALLGSFANTRFLYTWELGYDSGDIGDPPPCTAPTITEPCTPSCEDLYLATYDTPLECSGPVIVELQDGERVRNLYDGWGGGVHVPYHDTIQVSGTYSVSKVPVGGGSPVVIASGVGESETERYYLSTTMPTVVTEEVGSGSCEATTGTPATCEVLVRLMRRAQWTELPWGIAVSASAANRSLALSGTTLTLTVSGTPVTYNLTGKTVEDVRDWLDAQSLVNASLSTTAIGEHPATDMLAEFTTATIPHTGGNTLKMRLADYALGDPVEGTAAEPRWQVAQGTRSLGPDGLSSFTSYLASKFTGTELEFEDGIAGDWSHSPKPAVTLNGTNPHIFPTLTDHWLVPIADASVDDWCTTPTPDSAGSAWVVAPDTCTGYACKTTSESRRLGGHQAWSIQRYA